VVGAGGAGDRHAAAGVAALRLGGGRAEEDLGVVDVVHHAAGPRPAQPEAGGEPERARQRLLPPAPAPHDPVPASTPRPNHTPTTGTEPKMLPSGETISIRCRTHPPPRR